METQVQVQKSDARTKILQRVLNLRARAEDAGSSEAEMNTALIMCQKLMESYNIEEAELAIAEASGEIKLEVITKKIEASVLKGKKQKHKILLCLTGVEKFTETRCVFDSWSGAITFTGHRPDVELADFLTSIIKDALDREFMSYRKANAAIGYGAKTAFQTAMAYRVSQRLQTMAKERTEEREANKRKAEQLQIENAATASSTALVVSEIAEQKAKEVAAEFKKAHPRVRTVNTYTRTNNNTAYGAGRSAGDRVNLGRAIGQNSRKAIA
jgi:hypothetical protein